MPDSPDGAVTPGSGLHPAEALVLKFARRDAERKRDRPATSTTTEDSSGPGESALARAMRLAHVPEVYWQASWEKVRTPAVREWARTLEARARRHDDESRPNWGLMGRGLILLGGVGAGKSSAAGLICTEAHRCGRSVEWSYVPDLMDSLLDKSERKEIIRRQASVDVLVWDDFGVRSPASWEVEFMDQIVENRYRRRKLMVVTANLRHEDLRNDVRFARMVDRWRDRTAADLIGIPGVSMRGQR